MRAVTNPIRHPTSGLGTWLLCVFLAVLALQAEADALFLGALQWWMGLTVGCLMCALGVYGRGLHSFTLELNLSNSRTRL
jgi:hypothetical protein